MDDALGPPWFGCYNETTMGVRGGIMDEGCKPRCGPARLAMAMLFAATLTACSSVDTWLDSKPAPAARVSAGSSFGDRFRSLFGSGSEMSASEASAAMASAEDIECPSVDIRAGAGTLMNNAGNEQGALSLRYQATFGRTARECAIRGPNLSIKVGVQGRVIAGPAGAPPELTVPLRLALVREGVEPKTVWTKLANVPVVFPAGQPSVVFTHVEEDLTVPKPSAAELENYVIYVGYDPEGVAKEKKPPAKKTSRAAR
jgi:hypothetical protein